MGPGDVSLCKQIAYAADHRHVSDSVHFQTQISTADAAVVMHVFLRPQLHPTYQTLLCTGSLCTCANKQSLVARDKRG